MISALERARLLGSEHIESESAYRGGKRGRDFNLYERAVPARESTGGWLTGYAIGPSEERIVFDTQEKYGLAMDIAAGFNIRQDSRIYVPGVGLSDTALFLKRSGYSNVVAGDVKEARKALEYQKRMGVEIVESDILKDTLEPPADLVIDSSVLDVFLARPGLAISRAVEGLKRQMTQSGVLICYSMNNQTMYRQLANNFKHMWYAYIKAQAPQSLKGRTNKIVRSDISLWVCSMSADADAISSSLPKRAYLSPFLYNPQLSQIRNDDLQQDRFINYTNPSV